MPPSGNDVNAKIRELLLDLPESERRLLNRVLKLEYENLHLKQPRMKDEILQAVREIVK